MKKPKYQMHYNPPYRWMLMFEKPIFFGSATVGERGQIVLPISLRKKYQIRAGDKLIVVGMS
jgi:AbrB family looped-hinge helix DNA binding protein